MSGRRCFDGSCYTPVTPEARCHCGACTAYTAVALIDRRSTAENCQNRGPSRCSAVPPQYYPRHTERAVPLRCLYDINRSGQWHRHDRRGSAVVPSLIAVAPPKTVKTADHRGGTAETLNMFKASTVPPRVGPIRSGVAAAPP